MHKKTSSCSLPKLFLKPPVYMNSNKNFGLVMTKHVFSKAELREPALPNWLQPIRFKPKESKDVTIDITDFFSLSCVEVREF